MVGALALTQIGAAQTATVQAPVNLRVLSSSLTSIKLAWGPTEPGPFTVTSVTTSHVTLKWAASTDNGTSLTYTIRRDGNQVAVGYQSTSRSFQVAQASKSFRVCVQAVDSKARRSVWGCATVNRGVI